MSDDYTTAPRDLEGDPLAGRCVEGTDDEESIVAVVRDEFLRQSEFGCRPSAKDYAISIERWLDKGVMPRDDE